MEPATPVPDLYQKPLEVLMLGMGPTRALGRRLRLRFLDSKRLEGPCALPQTLTAVLGCLYYIYGLAGAAHGSHTPKVVAARKVDPQEKHLDLVMLMLGANILLAKGPTLKPFEASCSTLCLLGF